MNIKYLGTTTGFLGAIDAKDVVGVGFSIRVLTAVSAMGWYLFGDVFRGDPGTEGEQLRRSTVWRVLVGSGDEWPMFNRGNRDVPLHIFAAYGELIDGDMLKRFVNRRGATMKMSAFRVMPFEVHRQQAELMVTVMQKMHNFYYREQHTNALDTICEQEKATVVASHGVVEKDVAVILKGEWQQQYEIDRVWHMSLYTIPCNRDCSMEERRQHSREACLYLNTCLPSPTSVSSAPQW